MDDNIISGLQAEISIGITSLMRWSKRIEPCVNRYKPATKINIQALEQDVQQYLWVQREK